jgi:dihydrofolate reductase
MIQKILIAAIDKQGGIGKDGYMPWHYPEDLKSFMKLTMGNTIVMGRKTFTGMFDRGKAPLKGRRNIIVTSTVATYRSQFADKYDPMQLDFTTDINCGDLDLDGQVFYCGGAEIYRQSIESVDTIYLTRFHESYNCDTFFSANPLSSVTNFIPYIPPTLTLTTTEEISGQKPFIIEIYTRGNSTNL